MIIEAINKKPLLHFGFNKQSKTINLGNTVTVYQDGLIDCTLSENTAKKINSNQWTFTPTAIGVYNITATSTKKQISNQITLTVI